jgi:hypothetical protein
MAQLRHDYSEFVARDVAVVVVGPEDAAAFAKYFEKESLPFVGLPDPKHSVLKLYGQQVNQGRHRALRPLRPRHDGHPRERGAPGIGRRDQRRAEPHRPAPRLSKSPVDESLER